MFSLNISREYSLLYFMNALVKFRSSSFLGVISDLSNDLFLDVLLLIFDKPVVFVLESAEISLRVNILE